MVVIKYHLSYEQLLCRLNSFIVFIKLYNFDHYANLLMTNLLVLYSFVNNKILHIILYYNYENILIFIMIVSCDYS